MSKSICLETIFTHLPFEERIREVAQAGFKQVEFWRWQNKDIARLKKTLDNSGLTVALFSGDQSYSMVSLTEQEKYIDFVRSSLDVANELDAEAIVLHSNGLNDGGSVINRFDEIGNEKKFGTMVDTLLKINSYVEQDDVQVLIEPLNIYVDHPGNFLCSTTQAVHLVEIVGSPMIKILYDIYHMQIMEGNILSTLREHIASIGYIHFADVPGRHQPGTGEIHFEAVINELHNLAYSGTVGFEAFPKGDETAIMKMLATLW